MTLRGLACWHSIANSERRFLGTRLKARTRWFCCGQSQSSTPLTQGTFPRANTFASRGFVAREMWEIRLPVDQQTRGLGHMPLQLITNQRHEPSYLQRGLPQRAARIESLCGSTHDHHVRTTCQRSRRTLNQDILAKAHAKIAETCTQCTHSDTVSVHLHRYGVDVRDPNIGQGASSHGKVIIRRTLVVCEYIEEPFTQDGPSSPTTGHADCGRTEDPNEEGYGP